MNGWHNVSRGEPCPICHKTDWCNLSDDGAVVICHRVESGKLAKSGSGWIHVLRTSEERRVKSEKFRHSSFVIPHSSFAIDYARIHRSYDADPVLVEGLATMLGVDDEALKAMDVRYNWMDECWSFPMRDAEGKIVGLRYRELFGSRKWSAKGGKDGLFISGEAASAICRELVVLEGASDTAAALSLGLNAVGRSSCQTGAAQLKALIRRERPRIVTIVADNDEPGIRGAELLAQQINGSNSAIPNSSFVIHHSSAPVRILVVPHPYKDLRAWYTSGKLTAKVFNDIASAQRWFVV